MTTENNTHDPASDLPDLEKMIQELKPQPTKEQARAETTTIDLELAHKDAVALQADDAPELDQPKKKKKGTQTFADLGLDEMIVSALAKKNITEPTKVQAQGIPFIVEGRDLIAVANTGTGKTFAYLLPVMEKILKENKFALVIVPTRELAWQVAENLELVNEGLDKAVRSVTLIGGVPIKRQFSKLKNKPQMVIATPGRLVDHMKRKTLKLKDFGIAVLDEADRMLDMGFADEVKMILESLASERQTLMVSATMPSSVRRLATNHLKDPEEIAIARELADKGTIKQELCYVKKGGKNEVLKKLLQADDSQQKIVFVKTKIAAKNLTEQLKKSEIRTAEIHSDRNMRQRKQAMDGFKSGKFSVLVATDIAARGIDISNIGLVINYDLPQAAEDYVHRIGRTGRAGKSGATVMLATSAEQRKVSVIERIIKMSIPLSDLSITPENVKQDSNSRGGGKGRRRGGSSFGGRGGNNRRGGPGGGAGGRSRSGGGDRRRGSSEPREGGSSEGGYKSKRSFSGEGSAEGTSGGFKKRRFSENAGSERSSGSKRSYSENRGQEGGSEGYRKRSNSERGSAGGSPRSSAEGGQSRDWRKSGSGSDRSTGGGSGSSYGKPGGRSSRPGGNRGGKPGSSRAGGSRNAGSGSRGAGGGGGRSERKPAARSRD